MRALLIGYQFPPIGGVGVQRAVKMSRYLRDAGVETIVLTGPGHPGSWTPRDVTLLDEVRDVRVERSSLAPPDASRSPRARLERLLDLRTPFTRWWIDTILRDGGRLARSVDVILAEVAPYETAFGAVRLAGRTGLPWIADLQDPWALDEMWLYPSAIHRLRARTQMRRTLGTAAAVVMNTPEAAARVRRAFPELAAPERVVAIPNGFDSADFDGLTPAPRDDAFRIVHSGYLHTELALAHRRSRRLRRLTGGMPVPEVDFLSRSHVYLLEAVATLETRRPELRGAIEVHLVGNLTDADRAVAAPHAFVRLHGFQSHGATIALLKSADLLFLPMHDLPPGLRAGLVPSKTYEYVASGRPILAAVPDGDARDLLMRAGTATVCRPTGVECLADAILARFEARRAGEPEPVPDPMVVEQYEYRRLAARMAALIECVAGG